MKFMRQRLIGLPPVLIVAVLLITPCKAQEGPWAIPYEKPLRSEINENTLRIAADILQLSPEQQMALDRAFELHQHRFAELFARWDPVRKDFDSRLSNLPANSLARFNLEVEREKVLEKAAAEQAQLDIQFLDDIKPILADSQQAIYDQFRRKLNRERWLAIPFGYSEANLDIVAIVKQVSDEVEILIPEGSQEVIAAYEADLDRALAEHVAFRIGIARVWLRRDLGRYENDGKVVWMGRGTDADVRRYEQEAKRLGALLRQIATVNQKYVVLIAATLPTPLARGFEEKYLQAALMPYISKHPLRLSPYVEQVLSLPDLSPEQRGAVIALVDENVSKQRALERAILDAANSWVESRYDESSGAECARRERGVSEAVTERFQSDDALIRQIATMLTPDQLAEVASQERPASAPSTQP